MKQLLLIAFTLASFNVLASELGEDKKSDCPLINQSNKRESKPVVTSDTEKKEKEEIKNISK